MIGSTYQSKAIQAVLGPAHSSAIPSVLWSGWLDGSLTVLSMTGLSVGHSTFAATATGVANSAEVDGGVCPSTVPTYFGLFDSASGGDLVAYATATFETTPSAGDSLTFAAASLAFDYLEA